MLFPSTAAFGLLLSGTPHPPLAVRVRPTMSLDPADWKLLSRRDQVDGALTLAAAEAGTEAQVVTVTSPRLDDTPSLGLLLTDISQQDRPDHAVAHDLGSSAYLLRRHCDALHLRLRTFVSATLNAVSKQLTWIAPPLRGGGCAGPPS